MLSKPPATRNPLFSALIACGAADRIELEPKRRLIVDPGTALPRPESSDATRNVAIVLAGLVRAAEDDVVERVPIDRGIAGFGRRKRDRGQIIGADE